MPYINKERRGGLDNNNISPRIAGELNYMFTKTIIKYIKNNGESYQIYNEIIGALECCKLEIYRRLIAKYEEQKIKQNGDVF